MKRAEIAALRTRITEWLRRTRRLETDELVPGVVARTARLGDHLVIHHAGAHNILTVAAAGTGALVFVSEWHPSGEDSTPLATPEALATIAADLDAIAANTMVN